MSAPLDRGSTVPLCAVCIEAGRATEATHQTRDGCAAATNTSSNLNNTAVPRYADNEAQNRMDIQIVEHRLRAERLATDRLTRATKALVWATGALALATIALVAVTLTAAK